MNTENFKAEEGAKALSFQGTGAMRLYRFAFLSVLVLVSPLVFSQPITGSFVNAALFLSVVFFGFRKESFLIATVPSLVAVSTGQLPVAFAPLVPFIMAGNLLLVFVADRGFRNGFSHPSPSRTQELPSERGAGDALGATVRPYVTTAVVAAVAKSALLFTVGLAFSLTLFRGTSLSGTVLTVFGWLQLATALAGAAIAFGVLRILRREER
ncbi:MAG: hypothetical protein WCJ25_02680 [Candidatus Moraniibacteriota bacterium]